MFILTYNKIIHLLKHNKIDEAYTLATKLLKKNPLKLELYTIIAKIYLRQNKISECKNILLKLLLLPNWYNKKTVKEILEITNWKMLVTNQYLCKEPQFSSDGEKIVFLCTTEDTDGDGKITNDDFPGIYIIDRKGHHIECVVPNKFYNSAVSFSPDGNYICFLSARRDTNGDNKIN
ncbi:MAG: hypothetical protein NZ839_03490, partial [Endomicrobia bacterium]|nr:hypothetical protein [Endomicrobiia bacterium]